MTSRYVSLDANRYYAAAGTFLYAGKACLNWVEVSREDCELLLAIGYVAA